MILVDTTCLYKPHSMFTKSLSLGYDPWNTFSDREENKLHNWKGLKKEQHVKAWRSAGDWEGGKHACHQKMQAQSDESHEQCVMRIRWLLEQEGREKRAIGLCARRRTILAVTKLM